MRVASAALRTGDYSHVKNVFQIPLAHKHIVKKMPMFGQSMYPSCSEAIFLLEECVRNGELAHSAELKLEASIVVIVINAVPTKDSFTDH